MINKQYKYRLILLTSYRGPSEKDNKTCKATVEICIQSYRSLRYWGKWLGKGGGRTFQDEIRIYTFWGVNLWRIANFLHNFPANFSTFQPQSLSKVHRKVKIN